VNFAAYGGNGTWYLETKSGACFGPVNFITDGATGAGPVTKPSMTSIRLDRINGLGATQRVYSIDGRDISNSLSRGSLKNRVFIVKMKSCPRVRRVVGIKADAWK
jgi:hypothetical protein